MGHSSKKKKRGGGGGRRSKGSRADHNSLNSDDNELLAEEITSLCAIFQDDCRVVSDSPPQVNINLRPYSKDMGYEELDISALLSVRYLPGYPYKCPKLQISPDKGLSKSECDKLLQMLYDQANSNAREGRVMIYNLVEAAQEFLSEIPPVGRLHESELNLTEAAMNKLHTVGLRFCGDADQALPRLRGALPAEKATRKALDELAELVSYLRIWKIDKHVHIDPLMPPTESYHRNLFFQIFLRKDNNSGSLVEGTLLAVGGRYDHLIYNLWNKINKSNPPGAVGTSLALETIIQHCSVEVKSFRNDATSTVLVCSRGGGGLLKERMELVAKLWEEKIKAEFVPTFDPSLTEQYEYANERDIRCLVIITEMSVSEKGSVQVRHLELKRAKEVDRENLVKFLSDALASQFRNPSMWT